MNKQYNYSRGKNIGMQGIVFSMFLLVLYIRISNWEYLDILLIAMFSLSIIIQFVSIFYEATIGDFNGELILPRHLPGMGGLYFGNTIKLRYDQLCGVKLEEVGYKRKFFIEYFENNMKKKIVLWKGNFKENNSEEFINYLQNTINSNK